MDTLSRLETSSLGIEEPPLEGCKEADAVGKASDLALVPGLAFDRLGYRMGYGGGYYDEFLSRFEGVSMGLARSFERVERLAFLEAHDLAVDVVVDDDCWPG